MENEKYAVLMTGNLVQSCKLFLIGVLLAGACSSPSIKKTYILKEKMIGIMAEVYLVEMHYQKAYGLPQFYKAPLDSALEKIFIKHQVSKLSYEQSFRYYASRPDDFQEMNERVIQQYNCQLVK